MAKFHQIATVFRMRLVMAAKASTHAIFYSLNAVLKFLRFLDFSVRFSTQF